MKRARGTKREPKRPTLLEAIKMPRRQYERIFGPGLRRPACTSRGLGPRARVDAKTGELDLTELGKTFAAIVTKNKKARGRHFVQANACALGLNCMTLVADVKRGTVDLYSLSIPWARLGELVIEAGRRTDMPASLLAAGQRLGEGLDF